jgi:arylsulfatase A-like enzyme
MHFASLWLLACSGNGTEGRHESVPPAGDDTSVDDTDTGTGPRPPSDAVVLKKTPRNLLVISLDTVRRDRLDFFGDKGITPNLDAAFSGGVILEDHRSCSNWTAPSVYCAQSGNFQLDNDVWPTGLNMGERDHLVDWPPPDEPTLASLLSSAGFETTLITSNNVFSLDVNGGAFGFDREVSWIWATAPNVVDMAINNAADLGADGERWYYHVHFVDPHEQYQAPQEYWTDPDMDCPWDMTSTNVLKQLSGNALWGPLDDKEKELARACLFNVYEGELRYWDQELARFWSHFEKAGLLDDTLVVFWTDHGQAFGEHDDKFNHGVSLYDPETRSTAAFWSKDIEPLRWTGPTIHQDLAPTILEALDVPLGDHTGIVVGYAPEDRMRVAFDYFLGSSIPIISVVQGDLKLSYAWDGTAHFYDLGVDPDEQVDQYDASDPDVVRLWGTLEPLVEHTDEVWPGLNPVPP